MTVFVDQDVVRFYVPVFIYFLKCASSSREDRRKAHVCRPVNEPKVMDRFDRKDTFGHVEASDILGERVILYEHSHQVTPGKKFHDQVQVC